MLSSVSATVRVAMVSRGAAMLGPVAPVAVSRLAAVVSAYHTTARVASPVMGVNLKPLANPSPTLVVDEPADVMRGPKGRNISATNKQGMRLNNHERKVANAAKTRGYLVMGASCSTALCNWHLKYCWLRRRPYIAVSAHGDRIVDTLPVAGVGASSSSERVDRAIARFQAVVEKDRSPGSDGYRAHRGGVQVVNVEGGESDSGVVGDQFSLLTSNKTHAFRVASSLWAAYCDEFGEHTPEQLEAFRQKKYLERRARWKELMHRKLRRLVADPKLMRERVPKGALDGFIRADKEGRLETE